MDPYQAITLLHSSKAPSLVQEKFVRLLVALQPDAAITQFNEALSDPLQEKNTQVFRRLASEFMPVALDRIGDEESLKWMQETARLNRTPSEGETILINELLQRSPSKIADVYLESTNLNEPSDRMRSIIDRWAMTDPVAARNWIDENGGGEIIENVVEIRHASLDPQHFVNRFEKEVFSDHNSEMVKVVSKSLFKQNSALAVKLVESLGDERLFIAAADTLTREWIKHDSYAASQWIRGLPDGDARQAAINNLVTAIEKADPAAAAEWRSLLD